MILDEIVLHNFGPFRGRQQARLTPSSDKKSIVLIGGLNGGGKTTLLEGLQLALYGKLAACTRQNGQSYESYLQRCIHRKVKPSDGASVEISFRSTTDGVEREYRVQRSWNKPNGRLREHLDVFVDGRQDSVLSETWVEQVERFIPASLSYLFFFDGERIEALADPNQSSSMLSTAIHALLGVDLITQLQGDIAVLQRRRRKDVKGDVERAEIDQLESELEAVQDRLAELRQELAGLRNVRDRALKLLGDAEERFAQQGGTLVERRRDLEKKRANLMGRLETIRSSLVEAASGPLPLALTRKLQDEMLKQSDLEETAQKAEVLCASLKERDGALLKALKKIRAGKRIVDAADSYLQEDRHQQKQALEIARYLQLDSVSRSQLLTLLTGSLSDEQTRARKLVEQTRREEAKLDVLDRKLATVPDEASITQALKARDEARQHREETERRHAEVERQIQEMMTKEQDLAQRLEVRLRTQHQEELDRQDTQRFLNHADRVCQTMDRFRTALVERHARKLATLILEGYRLLLRKQSLVTDIHIDPTNCDLTLFTPDDSTLDPQRLSAGERQLLAVAMLWGLGRASGRPLPAIIDTPLGRLDSSHRTHLVNRYFPRASHQVILLSTDEEIDKQYYESLRPHIAHTYRLDHDDDSMASSIQPGYFW